MPLAELFDETLDINATENYELTVELSVHTLSFCILDAIRNKYIMFRAFEPGGQKKFTPDQLRELILKDDFLGKKYRKVHAVMSSPRYTLMPSALYDPAKKDEYFSFNLTVSENNIILADRIPDPDSFLLFAVRKEYLDIAREFFPRSVPCHHLRPLFVQIHHERKRSGNIYIHADIGTDYFTLIVFFNNTLKLCNSFMYRNVSDILYHVLNVFKSLGITQEESIVMSGQVEQFDDLSSSLSQYIRNIKFASFTGSSTFSYVFNDLSLQRYLTLFSAASCES